MNCIRVCLYVHYDEKKKMFRCAIWTSECFQSCIFGVKRKKIDKEIKFTKKGPNGDEFVR